MRRRDLLFLAIGGAIVLVWALLCMRTEPVADIAQNWAQSGHADRASESFVHWDEDEPPLVPTSCAKCHSSYGYMDYLGEDGTAVGVVDVAATTGCVVNCTTCHNPSASAMTAVTFPSDITITGLGPEATCMRCHQGRASGLGVDETLAGLEDDTVNAELGFINIHYHIAAGTQMGASAHGGYQYAGRDYVGRFEHAEGMQTCVECHDSHSLEVPPKSCSPCHLNVVDHGDLADIRTEHNDYDGDGDTVEGVLGEIVGMRQALYSAMQDYAAQAIGTAIVYDSNSYPYFFVDTDSDGQTDPDEANFGNRYVSWTPRLVRAAYNFQVASKDGGGFAHNPDYLLQLLHDSLNDLGDRVPVDIAGTVRP